VTIHPLAERRASHKRRILNAMIHLRPEFATVRWIARVACLTNRAVLALLAELERDGLLTHQHLQTPDGADDVYTFRKAA